MWAALQVEAGRCGAVFSVDITKAFEHVGRRLILEKAVALRYPPSAHMAALDVYAMKRRSVFRGCVGLGRCGPCGVLGPAVPLRQESCIWSWLVPWGGWPNSTD